MFERRHEPLVPRPRFAARMLRAFSVSAGLVLVALTIGAVGYHALERFGWVDSFYNAAMILAGMGPPQDLATDAGKIFSSLYALFSGLVFLSAGAVILTPLLHRLMHRFHLEDQAPGGS